MCYPELETLDLVEKDDLLGEQMSPDLIPDKEQNIVIGAES